MTLRLSLPATILMNQNGAENLACLNVVAISVSKALLWHSVEVRTRDQVYSLHCLGEEAATRLAADLYSFINSYLFDLIGSDTEHLNAVDTKLMAIVEGQSQYLAHADLARAVASVESKAAAALSHPLFDPELMTSTLKATLPRSLAFITDPAVRHRYNDAFVSAELARYRSFFDDLDGHSLSDQQREACIRLEDNNLLVASAGSGKSATMVGKVAYVLDKKLYRPEDILVLAFNKDAAHELKERVARQLAVDPDDLKCKVTTFHALGLGVIREVEGQPPQLVNWVEHPAGEAKVIEQIIDELLRSDPEFARLWVNLLVLHPKADIPAEVFDSKADYDRYLSARRRKGNATIGTMAGIYVKSLQEQTIVNWLWLHSVEFEYERQIPIEEDIGEIRHVHPDFHYPASNTIHEHLAVNADGSSPFENYVTHAEQKMTAYHKAGMDVFQTTSAQARDGSLLTALQTEITKRGIPLQQKSYTAIVKGLEPVVIKHYHKLIAVCIKHIRASHLTLDMLLERAKSLHDRTRAREFAQVIWKITESYSRKLDQAKRIDFDSMIANATHLVETRQYRSPYSLILVDEFQDVSEPRANLIKALKHQKPFTKMFAVGDDWQSIYRFAGSDITIFTQFEANFGASWQGRLEQTYRCNQLIAETAASFVQRNSAQLKKSVRSTRPTIPRSIRVIPISGEGSKPEFGEACHQLLQRLNSFLGGISGQWRTKGREKLNVMVLWRYNQLDPFKGTPPKFENIEVSGLSFHRAKGLEADYTILLDVSEGDYGVPSRIEDDELLNLVMPRPESFEFAEERRLFYVALTRASRGVFLLTNSREPSRYIRELSDIAGDDLRFESIDGDPLHQCPKCRVGQLVERNGRGNSRFLGCNQYPECEHTAQLR
ncbi:MULTISPECIES: UvrD-helicase domain-containing protein [Alphaproteobacteria]|uniref:DNA 3'-5' helicase n=2 Tax=Alphaproteobacteria TaxID=28211 RepID=A0A512HQ14_9HYPH|nr:MULTISPECIES: UvrD-helicase domain-containing protein [Alphaproteobacteria]GEO87544.1 DNA helicase [Ciceribacter naphthalenivorans]GLR23571.1 DNA helicase [Ciceribacter naphthalenivorans]GLT06427.1 DNA helicase [Sphingomonas psychrolutea]